MTDTVLPARVEKENGVYLELENFTGEANEAFRFYKPQFSSYDGAVKHFTREGDEGDKVVLEILNSALAFRARGKARQKLAKDTAENLKRIQRGDTLLLTEDEAMNFQPGSGREVSSEAGLLKAAKENKAKADEYEAAGDLEKASYHKSLVKQYTAQLLAKMQDLTS